MAMKRFLTLFLLVFPMIATPVLGVTPSDSKLSRDRRTAPSRPVQRARRGEGAPLATYEKTRPAKGKKIDFSSNSVKSHRAQLAALRNDFKQWLRQNAPRARVTSEFDVALNAVAVQLNGTSLADDPLGASGPVRRIPGTLPPHSARRPGPWAYRCLSGMATGARGSGARRRRRQDRDHRLRHRRTASLLQRRRVSRRECTGQRRQRRHERQSHPCRGLLQQACKIRLRHGRPERSRHARRRHRCLQRAHARVDRRPVERARRYPVRPIGRRPWGDARQLQCLPGHARKRSVGGHPERLAACV